MHDAVVATRPLALDLRDRIHVLDVSLGVLVARDPTSLVVAEAVDRCIDLDAKHVSQHSMTHV